MTAVDLRNRRDALIDLLDLIGRLITDVNTALAAAGYDTHDLVLCALVAAGMEDKTAWRHAELLVLHAADEEKRAAQIAATVRTLENLAAPR